MTEQTFWKIIDQACAYSGNVPFRNNDQKVSYLVNYLSTLPKEEIIDFERNLNKKVVAADHYNVMAVLKLVEGWVSDDPYLYFRYQVVLQGEQLFQAAINNTDSLAEVINRDSEIDGECFMTITDEVFEKKYGVPEDPEDYPRSHTEDIYGDTKGEKWEYEDLPIRFPQLWQKFHI